VIVEFEERAAEIERYFEFVAALEERRLTVENGELAIVTVIERELPDGVVESVRTITPIAAELEATLKAGFYLLVYNLVESSMRTVVMSIADELVQQRVPFPKIREELRKTIIKRFGKIGKDEHERILTTHGDLTADIVGNSFQPDMLFSGNVDAKRVREVAQEYGFTCTPLASDVNNIGSPILTVKSNRNDLAHGHKSFVEVGRDKVKTDLEAAKTAAIDLLRAVLTDVDGYIQATEYLDPAHRV
jgi:hypothetical protein